MMNKSLLYCILFCLLAVTSCHDDNSGREYICGHVVKIVDGDTYDLSLEDKTTIRVRMEGIDAPEKGMPYSQKSKQYLGTLCKGQIVKICNNKSDQYGRIISFSYLEDGRELSCEMLRAGYAWHFKRYNSDPEFTKLENEARIEQRGLWRDKNPMAPWINRKLHRQGISTKGMYKTEERIE